MHCPMCRALIDPAAQARACRHCPLQHWTRGCRLQLVRCPRCGYHSLPAEETGTPVNRPAVVPVAPGDGGPACPLGEMAAGSEARLVGFNGGTERDVQRLVAYGLVPGVRLKVLQRVPAYILKVHETELALEHSLAKGITVRPEPPPK